MTNIAKNLKFDKIVFEIPLFDELLLKMFSEVRAVQTYANLVHCQRENLAKIFSSYYVLLAKVGFDL